MPNTSSAVPAELIASVDARRGARRWRRLRAVDRRTRNRKESPRRRDRAASDGFRPPGRVDHRGKDPDTGVSALDRASLRHLERLADLRSVLATAHLSAARLLLFSPRSSDAEHACFSCSSIASLLFPCEAASEREPLLLVLDDIHATDMATLKLLQFVARGLRGSRAPACRGARHFATTEAEALLAQVVLGCYVRRQRLDCDRPLGVDVACSAASRSRTVSGLPPRVMLFVEELLRLRRSVPMRPGYERHGSAGIREAMRAHLSMVSRRALALRDCLRRRSASQFSSAIGGGLACVEALDEALSSGHFA